jgi:hypothetical protein
MGIYFGRDAASPDPNGDRQNGSLLEIPTANRLFCRHSDIFWIVPPVFTPRQNLPRNPCDALLLLLRYVFAIHPVNF